MKAAIYSRKSLFTGKGESIDVQINICKEYANQKGWETVIYEDEGFSGANINRPAFEQMIKDINVGKISNVIFYKLDRISRRVIDIVEFIERLNNKGVGFISVTESFDTTTPLGRAMLNIAATFAQLEREMLAERVRDNMINLAKTGRWLGGIPPTGFKSKEITFLNEQGKTKRMYALYEVSKEQELVNSIYSKYLEMKSLSQVEKFFLINNVKTKNGVDFQKQTIKTILTNPVYAVADELFYNYLIKENIQVASPYSDFDGKHGVLCYNKNAENKGVSNKLRDKSEWIVAVGKHKGIIESCKWIEVQNIINKNKDKAPRAGSSNRALLSGLLKCSKCGSPLIVRYGQRQKESGERLFYYTCLLKNLSSGNRCNNKIVRGDFIDNMVIEKVLELTLNKENIIEHLINAEDENKGDVKSYENKVNELRKQIKDIEDKIFKFVDLIGEGTDNPKYLMQRIGELDKEKVALEKQIDELSKEEVRIETNKINLEVVRNSISNFQQIVRTSDIEKKKALLRNIIDIIYWNDGEFEVNLFGTNKRKSGVSGSLG